MRIEPFAKVSIRMPNVLKSSTRNLHRRCLRVSPITVWPLRNCSCGGCRN